MEERSVNFVQNYFSSIRKIDVLVAGKVGKLGKKKKKEDIVTR